MNRVTLRTSTILIATKEKTDVYRNLKDVPPKLRRKLVQTTSGANSATILIADRKGRQELARAVRGLPGSSGAELALPAKSTSLGKRQRGILLPLGVIWAEVLIAGGLGLLIWLLITTH
jgi:hypothetical protein